MTDSKGAKQPDNKEPESFHPRDSHLELDFEPDSQFDSQLALADQAGEAMETKPVDTKDGASARSDGLPNLFLADDGDKPKPPDSEKDKGNNDQIDPALEAKPAEESDLRNLLRDRFLKKEEEKEVPSSKGDAPVDSVKEAPKLFEEVSLPKLKDLSPELIESISKEIPELQNRKEFTPDLLHKIKENPLTAALIAVAGYQILKIGNKLVFGKGKAQESTTGNPSATLDQSEKEKSLEPEKSADPKQEAKKEGQTLSDRMPALERSTSSEVESLNRQVGEILKPVDSVASVGGDFNTPELKGVQNRAIKALLPEAEKIASKLGLPKGAITEKLFEFGKEIDISTGANKEGGYSAYRNKVVLDPGAKDFVTTLEHELGHMQRALSRAAMREADPVQMDKIILDKALSEVGTGRPRRYNGRVEHQPAYESPQAREQMKELLTRYVGEKADSGTTWYDKTEIGKWLEGKEVPEALKGELGGNQEIAREMKAELINYLHAKGDTTTNSNALDPASREYVERQADVYKQWVDSGKPLSENPQVAKLTSGIIQDAHSMADRRQYEFSVEEIRSRRLQRSQDLARQMLEQKTNSSPELTAKIEASKKAILVENKKEGISNALETISIKGDSTGELMERARGQARELLEMLPENRASSKRAVHFMLEKGLLQPQEVSSSSFSVEAMLHQGNSANPLRVASDGDFKPSEMASLGEESIARRVEPLADALARPEPTVSLERMEAVKEAILRSPEFRKDKGQANVYDLLSRPNNGVLARLQAEGRVPPGWEIYPTEAGSPADKVGADYLLVNRQSGEFHLLDATQRSEKGNVFGLRKDGVILYDNKYFDRSGAVVKAEPGVQETDIERSAREFETGLEQKLIDMTSKKSPFRLGETPLPDIRKTTPEATTAQIDKLIDWAKQKGSESGERGRGQGTFSEMADVLERGAKTFEKISQAEVSSPELSTRVRQLAEKEIARYALAEASRQKYEPKEAKSPQSDIYYHEKSGGIKMRTSSGERFDGGDMPTILTDTYRQLQSHGKILSVLSNADLQKLKIDPAPFKGLSGADREKAFDAAFRDSKHPQHRQVRYGGEMMLRALTNVRQEIEAGGAVGGKRPVIVDSIVETLKGRGEDNVLGREQIVTTPKVKAPTPSEVFGKELPNASKYLSELIPEEVSSKTVNENVSSWLDAMIEEQSEIEGEKKWSEAELKKLSQVRDAYKAGDPATIEKIHDYLTGEARTKAIAEAGNTPVLDAGRPSGQGGNTEVESGVESDQSTLRRRVRSPESLERQPTRVVQSDGTSQILDPAHPTAKLSWKERLTDRELAELDSTRKLLEERVKGGERLGEVESRELEALRYLEKNKYDQAVHRELLSSIEKIGKERGVVRPEGGFKAGEVGGRLTAVAILTTAVLGVYISSEHQGGDKPLRRAGY